MGSLWSILLGCGLLVAVAGVVGSWLDRTQGSREHDSPAAPFSIEQAHTVMQSHCGCRADDCSRKAAAFRALVEAGRIVPDARADRYSL
ncbi:hypothetical protein OG225_30080 [Nocardia sp. NBC_01377]|uniref:hypothetical protein n=1 Tax=Nocardia TaxID=1817 RepID=UPI001C22E2AC|nr:hypothetical protein [Nocardia noduli]